MSRRVTGVPQDMNHGPRRGLAEVLAIGMYHQRKKHGPKHHEAPKFMDYTFEENEAKKLLDWMHRTLNWYARRQTRVDIVAYLSGKNKMWDTQGITRLEQNVKVFFDFLKHKRFISDYEYDKIEKEGHKYLSEYAYVVLRQNVVSEMDKKQS